jgi:hypothetical protein
MAGLDAVLREVKRMDDDAEKIVNIKGISAKEWEKARGIATRNGEGMGQYVSRALAQLADREAGERFFPPDRFSASIPPDSPPSIPPLHPKPSIDMRDVAAILIAMKEAGLPVQKRVGREINAALHAMLREGREEDQPRLIQGLTSPEIG